MLVVIDAVGLYDNIPPEEGVTCVGETPSENPSSKVPAQLIMRMYECTNVVI